MPMTTVVTINVAPRVRGFLASCMLEVAPGVYTSPRMSKAVRVRVWDVLEDWHGELGSGGILMTWRDTSFPGSQAIEFLGTPPRELFNADGIFLARRDLPASRPNTSTD